MKKVTIMEALGHSSPQPVSLICVPRPDGATNLAPVAWWTYLESEPPMVGFSMAKQSYTAELLANTDKLALVLPAEEIADVVLKCGMVTGRDVDKAVEYGIALVGGDVKYPVHSKLAFVCAISQRVVVGDCIFFVCDVTEILLDETKRHIYTANKMESLRAITL